MTVFIHSLVEKTASQTPEAPAITHKTETLSYQQLYSRITQCSEKFRALGLKRFERVAIFLPKNVENVVSTFATSMAGGVFVPVNPLLKGPQTSYILNDCNVRILLTHSSRLKLLEPHLQDCPDLHTIICVDIDDSRKAGHIDILSWQDFEALETNLPEQAPVTDADMAAILYTSGSTGNPKGVVLSHRNMVVGAESVAEYLENTSHDRILAVLPFSFDYGFSQLTTSFLVGAHCFLLDYLLPNDIMKMVERHEITGLAAVPPLWSQLTKLDWKDAGRSLRYFTNSGGAMPEATLKKLRTSFSNASPYLMYGLTEAFRSTFLPPSEVDNRPTSMGKAIPNAEIKVVRPDGSLCADNEPGELVHSGPLVSMGYWNAPDKTSERFKNNPGVPQGIMTPQLAVWAGDTVYRDEDGFLYFVGRADDMIKTSGYRVSPTEVEETVYSSDLVVEAAALGIPHQDLGQAIVIIATSRSSDSRETVQENILKACQKNLPNFMVPKAVLILDALPHNQNGKINRKQLVEEYANLFSS